MGKGKRKAEQADRRSGSYFLFPQCLLDSAAWRALSPFGVKLLMGLCAHHNGWNNGKITFSARQAAESVGTVNFHAIARGFRELELLGFVALEKDHPRGQRLAREYRLTFVGVGERPATNEYLGWAQGDAGTRNKRVAPNAAATSLSAAVASAETKLSAASTAADEAENVDFANVSAASNATHRVNHRGGSSLGRSNHPRVTADLNGGSAAPSEDELRERVTASLDRYGRGTQSKLAELAEIPPGTFSRFINRDGPLNAPARIRLTCAMPRLEMHERLSESATA